MNRSNEETKNKLIRFSIGTYDDKDKRVIDKIARNGLFSSSNCVSLHKTITSPEPFQALFGNKSAILNKSNLPKFNTQARIQNSSIGTATNFSLQNSSTNTNESENSFQKPKYPPSSTNNDLLIKVNEPFLSEPTNPLKLYNRSLSLHPDNFKKTNNVALIITPYEGEPQTPMRLTFLPQMNLLRSNSKTNIETSNLVDNAKSISSRLQDELISTLKKSNLKNKNDKAENGSLNSPENNREISNQNKMETEFINKKVKKLSAVLDQKIMFRINPESSEQVADNKIDV